MKCLINKIIKKILWVTGIWKIYADRMNEKYIRTPAEYMNLRWKNSDAKCDVVTIAFNNPNVIRYQILSLNKYFVTPFTYYVADNSNDEEKSSEIRRICEATQCNYIKLPHNQWNSQLTSGESHATALNWVFHNILVKEKTKFVGILDHDIFLKQSFDLEKTIGDKDVYGRRIVLSKWYLWPGLFFMRKTFLLNRKIDFRPGNGCDTGGNFWTGNESTDICVFSKEKHEAVNESAEYCFQQNCFEVYDDMWIHMVNGSGWMKGANIEEKENYIYSLLDRIIVEEKNDKEV